MQPGSPLVTALEDTGADIHRFCWSGRNRQADRFLAGEELHEHLVHLVARSPSANHQIVAHSHGGNVALYALRDGEKLDPLLTSVQVATLATPFLVMRPRRLPSLAFRVAVVFFGVMSLVWALGMVAVAMTSEPILEDFTVAEQVLAWIVYSFALLLVATAVSSAHLYARCSHDARWALLRGRATRREAARVTVPPIDAHRFLIIRATGDEAGGLLSGAQVASWLARRVISLTDLAPFYIKTLLRRPLVRAKTRLRRARRSGVLRFPLLASGAVVEALAYVLLALYAGVLVVLMLFLSPVVALLLVITNLPFGFDTLFWNIFAFITAEPTPPGTYPYTHVSAAAGGDLAHGVYDEPEAIAAVVGRLTGSATEARTAAKPQVRTLETT